MTEAKVGVMWLQTKEHQHLLEAGRGTEQMLSWIFRKTPVPSNLGFRPVKTHFWLLISRLEDKSVLFSGPTFVTVAMGNEYNLQKYSEGESCKFKMDIH